MALDTIRQRGSVGRNGNTPVTEVRDEDLQMLLADVLLQLRIMNAHLAIISDHEIAERDL